MTDRELLSDEQIIDGLRRQDCDITRQYFYGYCRMAYCLCDRRYQLRYKQGMDFYSLAHEYYLKLALTDWKQLADRKAEMTLRQWMMNGFRYVVLDRLKAWQRESKNVSLEERLNNPTIRFDIADNHFKEDFHQTVEEICQSYYRRDLRSQTILRLLLIDGMKGKDVAAQLGITPSAVTQRYRQMMVSVVVPYFKNYYSFSEAMGEESAYSVESSESREIMPRKESTLRFSLDRDAMFEPNIPHTMDYSNRITPDFVSQLNDGEIFVFGSNLRGMHGGGAARIAHLRFGAQMGQGVGLQGRSYAIPTMQGGPETIRPYVDEFISFARKHREMTFLVTRIGCGIAGFDAKDIAPLFVGAKDVDNIHLPRDFWTLVK